ncbi:hypothetical protein VTN02DRAFT_1326 [Thermoascus thermophilus]
MYGRSPTAFRSLTLRRGLPECLTAAVRPRASSSPAGTCRTRRQACSIFTDAGRRQHSGPQRWTTSPGDQCLASPGPRWHLERDALNDRFYQAGTAHGNGGSTTAEGAQRGEGQQDNRTTGQQDRRSRMGTASPAADVDLVKMMPERRDVDEHSAVPRQRFVAACERGRRTSQCSQAERAQSQTPEPSAESAHPRSVSCSLFSPPLCSPAPRISIRQTM